MNVINLKLFLDTVTMTCKILLKRFNKKWPIKIASKNQPPSPNSEDYLRLYCRPDRYPSWDCENSLTSLKWLKTVKTYKIRDFVNENASLRPLV